MAENPPFWDITQSSPAAPEITDSRGEEVRRTYFEGTKPSFNWKLSITASLAVGFGALVVAVGAYVFRHNPPALVSVPAASTEQSALESTAQGMVFVHVAGAVQNPGVVEVPADSRVMDAIEKAGGATEEASLDNVNLARLVFDGEHIVIPRLGDAQDPETAAGSGLISLSSADEETLDSLPRIGPATAQRIIAWREQNGPFRSVDDLLAISGIGPATLEGLRPLVTP